MRVQFETDAEVSMVLDVLSDAGELHFHVDADLSEDIWSANS